MDGIIMCVEVEEKMDDRLQFLINLLESKYNGDFDVAPGMPLVTWTDHELLEMIRILLQRVETLENQLMEMAG